MDQHERAKKRVADIESFWSHLTVYVVIIVVLLLIDIFAEGNSNNWRVQWPALGWSVFVALHGAKVYGPFTTAGWEQRKIKELMEEESRREN